MTQQPQPMYFGDLFAEIESNVNHPHPHSHAHSQHVPVPPPPTPRAPGAGPSAQHNTNNLNLSVQGGAAAASGDLLAFNMPDGGVGAMGGVGGVIPKGASDSGPLFLSVPLTPAEAAEAERANGKRRKQELHRRHSKRYRDNLGDLFHELELILPQVVPDCKLKTKSQIIATSVNAVKQLKGEVSALEMRYVMSSASNRARWVEDTVSNATIIQDAIEPFMRLLLGLQSWKHAELWMNLENATDGTNMLKLERVSTSTEKNSANKFLEFVRGSQVMQFVPGDDSLVGRIASSLQPEWLDLTNDTALAGFKRGKLAIACGLCVCFAVPFLVRGHVVSVVLFYDNTPRADVLARVTVAQDLASSIGNCFGALSINKSPSVQKSSPTLVDR